MPDQTVNIQVTCTVKSTQEVHQSATPLRMMDMLRPLVVRTTVIKDASWVIPTIQGINTARFTQSLGLRAGRSKTKSAASATTRDALG